jgi:hypothetical protein
LAATCGSGIHLLAPIRQQGQDCSSWQWVARLPVSTGNGPQHLSASGGCGSVVAAAGDQLLQLSDIVQLPQHRQSALDPLGRLLLDAAGPLPQYHPSFLAALLLSGKHKAVSTILGRLEAWLAALRQQSGEGEEAAGDAALQQPASPVPGAHIAGGDGLAAGMAGGPLPSFAGNGFSG